MTHLVTSYLHATFIGNDWLERFEREVPLTTILVGTGLSGTLACAKLAYIKKYQFCIVRKEGSHSSLKVEGWIPSEEDKWVIVDDCIASGSTVKKILSVMKEKHPECVEGFSGAYLIEQDEWLSPEKVFAKADYRY